MLNNNAKRMSEREFSMKHTSIDLLLDTTNKEENKIKKKKKKRRTFNKSLTFAFTQQSKWKT